jgi:hypothetical protein
MVVLDLGPIESLLCRLEFPVLIFHQRGAERTKAWLWNGHLSEFIGNCSGGNRFNFPVFFPVTGNLPEKGSLTTGSSASPLFSAAYST